MSLNESATQSDLLYKYAKDNILLFYVRGYKSYNNILKLVSGPKILTVEAHEDVM